MGMVGIHQSIPTVFGLPHSRGEDPTEHSTQARASTLEHHGRDGWHRRCSISGMGNTTQSIVCVLLTLSVGCMIPVYYEVPTARPGPNASSNGTLMCVQRCRATTAADDFARCVRECPDIHDLRGSCEDTSEYECVKDPDKKEPGRLMTFVTVIAGGALLGALGWFVYQKGKCLADSSFPALGCEPEK